MNTKRHRLALEEKSTIIKDTFESELKKSLSLIKVNAPLFVPTNSGLNDNLNGIEKAVTFYLSGTEYQIVHSLAKWKRWYLGELNSPIGEGIITNMIAIRADEKISPIHSNLVDQWDWEKVISKEDRTIETLIEYGENIYKALKKTEESTDLTTSLPEKLTIIHSEDLLQLYPDISPKEREHEITKKYGAIFLIGIGGNLSNGIPHDFRAPDYDDWTTLDKNGKPGLNADIIIWDTIRQSSLEISSMGIRVNEITLKDQLTLLHKEDRMEFPFHKKLLNGNLPLTIGGGIGQSRVAMLLSKQPNIKNVQAIY